MAIESIPAASGTYILGKIFSQNNTVTQPEINNFNNTPTQATLKPILNKLITKELSPNVSVKKQNKVVTKKLSPNVLVKKQNKMTAKSLELVNKQRIIDEGKRNKSLFKRKARKRKIKLSDSENTNIIEQFNNLKLKYEITGEEFIDAALRLKNNDTGLNNLLEDEVFKEIIRFNTEKGVSLPYRRIPEFKQGSNIELLGESFSIIKRLGDESKDGVVYMVKTKTGNLFALKINKKIEQEDEGRKLKRINELVDDSSKIYDFGDFDLDGYKNIPYILIDYIDGITYYEFHENNNCNISGNSACEIMRKKVCNCINKYHEKGISHQDLHFKNIIIDSSGEPRAIDFSRAKVPFDPTPNPLSNKSRKIDTNDFKCWKNNNGNLIRNF